MFNERKFKKIILIVGFITLVTNMASSQTKSYLFTIWNLKGEQINDANISVWKSTEEGQLIQINCEIKANGGNYNLNCHCTVQNFCDSNLILKIEHSNYLLSQIPLFMIRSGDKILIGEKDSYHYHKVRYSLKGQKGIYVVPYIPSPNRIKVMMTERGYNNLEKVKRLLDANMLEFAEKIDSSNMRKTCGLLVKKKNDEPFSKDKCVELNSLRKNKMISFAGPSINYNQNAFTNYLIIKAKYESKNTIKKNLSRFGKIIKQQGAGDLNGDGKYDFIYFLVEANEEIGLQILSLIDEIFKNEHVLQCDPYLFCDNPSDIFFHPRMGKSKSTYSNRHLYKWHNPYEF